nr:glycosyltransferase [Sulfitobacter sp. M220]
MDHPDTPLSIRILHVAPTFFPAIRWGGPIFSTKAICDGVSATPCFEIQVHTTDAAGPDPYDNLELEELIVERPEGYTISYHRRVKGHAISWGLLRALPMAIRQADVVHLTSAYSFPTLPTLALARIFRRPVVWSPRGAIQATEEWQQAPRKRLKKIFEVVAKAIMSQSSVFHVTATSEAEATARRMPGHRMVVIPNSVQLPAEKVLDRPFRPAGKMRLMFLSRIHEKKGLDILIDALAQLPEHISLDIYGTGEAKYLAQLMEKFEILGVSDRVTMHGHVNGIDKTRAFERADIFVLPSYSENFGIVIAEALAHGLPVITTNATPWGALDAEGCGICVPVSTISLQKAIADFEQKETENLAAMGLRGRKWVARDFTADATTAEMIKLYKSLVDG